MTDVDYGEVVIRGTTALGSNIAYERIARVMLDTDFHVELEVKGRIFEVIIRVPGKN